MSRVIRRVEIFFLVYVGVIVTITVISGGII